MDPPLNNPKFPILDDFITKTLSLLEMEHTEEVQKTEALLKTLSPKVGYYDPLINSQELSDRGVILDKLEFVTQSTGLGGKVMLRFEPKMRDAGLKPGNKFQPGDIVGIQDEQTKETTDSGVVFRITQKWIQVALSKPSPSANWGQSSYTLIHLANSITFRRMKLAIDEVLAKRHDSLLARVLFGEVTPSAVNPIPFTPINQNLNESQIEAISFALGSKDIALIHGPPGTGKTTTVIELIIQTVKRGEKVLVCAPSNIAVDNIAEKLAKEKVRMVRLGHPARLLPTVIEHALDIVVQSSNGGEVVRGVYEDMDKVQAEMRDLKGWSRDKKFKEWIGLKKELREREAKAVGDVLGQCDVILATCSGAADRHLKKMNQFDLVVIDEAGQALEAACWIPLLKGKRAVLAGDHLQLPPTIHSEKAAKDGLSITLFERIIKTFGDRVSRMLRVQYRMNTIIMDWSSKALYKSKLIAHEDVKDRLLTDFGNVKKTESSEAALAIIDTQGCFLHELEDVEGSKYNEGEAAVCLEYVREIIDCGVALDDIAIISPYYAQVKILRQQISPHFPGIDVNTVDGFQGREKEVIIISMVRSNDKREVGFLSEKRRMNVAVTRAKRHCCIICDTETVKSEKFLRKMVSYFESNGLYLSAASFITSSVKTPIPSPTPALPQKPNNPTQPIQQQKTPVAAPSSGLTPFQIKLIEQLEELKKNPSNEENPKIDFKQPLSKINLTMVLEKAEELGLKCKVTVLKGSSFVVVYLNEVEEEKIEEKIESKNEEIERIEENESDSDEPVVEVVTTKKAQPKAQPKKQKKEPPRGKFDDTPKEVKIYQSEFRRLHDEAALQQVLDNKNSCHFPKCKGRTTNLSSICEFCKEGFCFEHGNPIKHGCGDAAREQAHREFKEKAKKDAQGPYVKPLNATQKALLNAKFQKKVEEQKASRAKKPSKQQEEGAGRGTGTGRGGGAGRGAGRGRGA